MLLVEAVEELEHLLVESAAQEALAVGVDGFESLLGLGLLVGGLENDEFH